MKKLLVLVSILMLVSPANAYYVTTSPNGGGFTNVNTFGNHMYNTNSNNFGSNAPFLPQNVQRASMVQNQIRYEKQYLDSLKNTQNINVNVNHNGYPVSRYYTPNVYNNGYYGNTYYNNGYNRYYNNGYLPTNGIYYNRGNGIVLPGVRVY